VRGEELDVRTDLFSFGVVLYEMRRECCRFAGIRRESGATGFLNRTPTPAVRLNPEVPAKLEEILNKALEKNREAALPERGGFARDLQRLRAGYGDHGKCEARVRTSRAHRNRRAPEIGWPRWFGVGVGGVGVTAGGRRMAELFAQAHAADG